MKSMMVLALLAFAGSVYAEVNTKFAEYYTVDYWPGEYPTGYELVSDVEVVGLRSPDNPIPVGICTLKKKSVIHPWAKKTKSEFASIQGVGRFIANKDFEVWKSMEEKILVKAGEEVLQLGYLSEGICLMSVRGELVEDGCLSEQDERATVTFMSPIRIQSYFRTSCKEGYEAWISEDSLSDLVGEDEPVMVKYAEIIDFGEVREP